MYREVQPAPGSLRFLFLTPHCLSQIIFPKALGKQQQPEPDKWPRSGAPALHPWDTDQFKVTETSSFHREAPSPQTGVPEEKPTKIATGLEADTQPSGSQGVNSQEGGVLSCTWQSCAATAAE